MFGIIICVQYHALWRWYDWYTWKVGGCSFVGRTNDAVVAVAIRKRWVCRTIRIRMTIIVILISMIVIPWGQGSSIHSICRHCSSSSGSSSNSSSTMTSDAIVMYVVSSLMCVP